MNRKRKFLEAVRILAPNDITINRLARAVREETLPLFPGGAALEFVARMEGLHTHSACSAPRRAPALLLSGHRRRSCTPTRANQARPVSRPHCTHICSE